MKKKHRPPRQKRKYGTGRISGKKESREMTPLKKKKLPFSMTTPKTSSSTRPVVTKINTLWFKEILLKKHISQRQVAKALNVDPSAVSLILTGRRRLQMEEAVALSDLLNEPLSLVLSNTGSLGPKIDVVEKATLDPAKTTEIIGWVGDNLLVHWETLHLRGDRMIPGSFGPETKGLRIQTEGTRFSGLDGGVLFLSPEESPGNFLVGKLCAVTLVDHTTWVRVLKKGYKTGRYDLHYMDGEVSHQDVLVASVRPILGLKF